MSTSIAQILEKEVIPRLAAEFRPEAIYLFGSHAWGRPAPDSDLDLLVIVADSSQTPTQRAARAQHSLRGLMFSIDELVKTRAEFERYLPVYASLEAQVLEEGKLLYGRKVDAGEKLARQSAA
jgi:predicted nucleotidyltransferase